MLESELIRIVHRNAISATIHELNSAGEVANYGLLLQAARIMPGAAIQKEKGERLVVVAVSPREVDVYSASDKKRKKVTLSAKTVLDEYKVSADGPTTVTGKELAKLASSLNEDAQFELAVGCLQVALACKEQELGGISMGISVTTAPANARNVVATKGFAKGAQLFVPCSTSISKAVEGKTYPDTAVHVKNVRSPTSSRTWDVVVLPKIVMPASGDDAKPVIIPPFWFVKTTHHAELANAHIVYEEYELGECWCRPIPVMAAKKTIEAGAEVVCHRPKKAD